MNRSHAVWRTYKESAEQRKRTAAGSKVFPTRDRDELRKSRRRPPLSLTVTGIQSLCAATTSMSRQLDIGRSFHPLELFI